MPQVAHDTYLRITYDTKARWMSYWHQIDEVVNKQPDKVLEIGIGNRLVSDYLQQRGLEVIRCDFDADLKPEVVGDVAHLPFKDNVVDVVLCAQLLEHLPFELFVKCLDHIYRVTRQWAVVTLPDANPLTHVHIGFKGLPFVPKVSKTWKIGWPRSHSFQQHGQHYWEIGKRGYPVSRIKAAIQAAGFEITKSYIPEENQYHYFFVLRKP